MSVIELKHNLHQLIDDVNNEDVLSKFYLFLTKFRDTADGTLWSKLTKEEQEELLLSDMESDDQNNLISYEEIKKKHSQWL